MRGWDFPVTDVRITWGAGGQRLLIFLLKYYIPECQNDIYYFLGNACSWRKKAKQQHGTQVRMVWGVDNSHLNLTAMDSSIPCSVSPRYKSGKTSLFREVRTHVTHTESTVFQICPQLSSPESPGSWYRSIYSGLHA